MSTVLDETLGGRHQRDPETIKPRDIAQRVGAQHWGGDIAATKFVWLMGRLSGHLERQGQREHAQRNALLGCVEQWVA